MSHFIHAGSTTASSSRFRIPTTDSGSTPATGVFTDSVAATLPQLTDDATVIDGTTQTAFTGDTNPDGWEVVVHGHEVYLNGDENQRVAGNLNVSFAYVEGESLIMALKDLAVSSGSACTSGSLEPSHVMRAMGIPYTAAHGTIRFSLSRYNTMDEIERVIEAVPPIVAQLRKLSPYWGEDGPVDEPEKIFAPTYA